MASVLVVDDDQTVRQILEKLLRRSSLTTHGVVIELAEDGNQAWELIQKRRPDVVVLDLLMPGKSGIELARAIRQSETGFVMKIMLMSGVYPERTINRDLVAMRATFFAKPKGIVDIPAAIEKALGLPAAAPPQASAPPQRPPAPTGPGFGQRPAGGPPVASPLLRSMVPGAAPAVPPKPSGLGALASKPIAPGARPVSVARVSAPLGVPILPSAPGLNKLQPTRGVVAPPRAPAGAATPPRASAQPPRSSPPSLPGAPRPLPPPPPPRPSLSAKPTPPAGVPVLTRNLGGGSSSSAGRGAEGPLIDELVADRRAFAPEPSRVSALDPVPLEPTPVEPVSVISGRPASLRPPTHGSRPPTPVPVAAPPVAAKRTPARVVELGEVRLPALLLELVDDEFSGLVEIQRNRIERGVELDAGHVIEVTSNQRVDTLGQFLVVRGVLKPEQHEEAIARAQASSCRLGEALVELGFLTASQLVGHLREQMRHKLAASLRWDHGTARLFPRAAGGGGGDRARGAGLDLPSAIFGGLREGAVLEDAVRVCGKLAGHDIVFNERGRRHEAAFALAFGAPLAQALARGARAEEIFRLSRQEPGALPGLEALILCDALGFTAEDARALSPPAAASSPAPAPAPASVPPPAVAAPAAWPSSWPGAAPASTSPVTPPPVPPAPPPAPPERPTPATEQLAELAARRGVVVAAPIAVASPSPTEALYDSLFADVEPGTGSSPTLIPSAPSGVPIFVEDEHSGFVDIKSMQGDVAAVLEARDELQRELLRIQGKDHYLVLGIARRADAEVISEAVRDRIETFSIERYRGIALGPEQATLELVHRAYQEAAEALGEPASRAAYDARLGGPAGKDDVFEVELVFLEGERLLAAGDLTGAVERFRAATARRPDADYLAACGAALVRLGERERAPALTDEGRAALERALAEDGEHAGANAALGAVLARAGRASEALPRLELALASSPLRFDALEAYEEIYAGRQDWRVLESTYRRLIDREPSAAAGVALWTRLGMLFREKLDDPEAARLAFQCAFALAPEDATLRAAALEEDPAAGFAAEVTRTRSRLREPKSARLALGTLFETAVIEGEVDASWVVAGLLVGLGDAAPHVASAYGRGQPAKLPLMAGSMRLLDTHWARLRHPDDDPLVGQLFALLTPMIREVVPLGYEDLGLAPEDVLDASGIPASLAELRDVLASFFGVPAPDLALHRLAGPVASVGALIDPVVLIGPELARLDSETERAYRLARAMSYLLPGRAAGGSLRGRVLKALLFAAISLVAPVTIDDPAGVVARGRAWLAQSPPAYRGQVAEVVGRLTHAHEALDLSAWAAALARTSDRAALLAIGDPAAAVRVVLGEAGTAALPDLLEFALSPVHLALRRELGIAHD